MTPSLRARERGFSTGAPGRLRLMMLKNAPRWERRRGKATASAWVQPGEGLGDRGFEEQLNAAPWPVGVVMTAVADAGGG